MNRDMCVPLVAAVRATVIDSVAIVGWIAIARGSFYVTKARPSGCRRTGLHQRFSEPGGAFYWIRTFDPGPPSSTS